MSSATEWHWILSLSGTKAESTVDPWGCSLLTDLHDPDATEFGARSNCRGLLCFYHVPLPLSTIQALHLVYLLSTTNVTRWTVILRGWEVLGRIGFIIPQSLDYDGNLSP